MKNAKVKKVPKSAKKYYSYEFYSKALQDMAFDDEIAGFSVRNLKRLGKDKTHKAYLEKIKENNERKKNDSSVEKISIETLIQQETLELVRKKNAFKSKIIEKYQSKLENDEILSDRVETAFINLLK